MAKSESKKSKSNKQNQSDRVAMPFEPKGSKSKSGQKQAADTGKKAKANKQAKSSESTISARAQAQVDAIRASNRKKAKAQKEETRSTARGSSGQIPEVVSRRMLRRMAVFSGMPVFLGVGIFFLAYYIRSRGILEFAPVAVLLVTMGCFGLGVLGLTYGVLSASWDDAPGGLVGFEQFKLNFGRIMEARRAGKASKT